MEYNLLMCPTDCSPGHPISINAVNIKSHPWHLHDKFEIIYLLEGNIDVNICFYSFHLTAGDFMLINSEVPHMVMSQSDNKVISYHFDLDFFEDYIPHLKDYIFIMSEDKINSSDIYSTTVKTHLKKLAYLYFSDSENSSGQLLDTSSAMFSLLTSHFSQWQQKDNVISQASSYKAPVQFERLNRILNYIYDHFSEKITLDTIANQEYLSRYYISHIFSEGLGMSFQDYLSLARVENAYYLLLSTANSLADISESCGFSNLRSFRQAFIKYTGMTPQEVRAKYAGFTIDDMPLIESNLFDSISPEYFIQTLGASQQINPPDFSNISKPEIRHIYVDLHNTKKSSDFFHLKTAIIDNINDMFSHSFEEAADTLNRFSFESVTIYAPTLTQFKDAFKSFAPLIPILRILKEHGLRLNVSGASASLKKELEALCKDCSKYALITFNTLPNLSEAVSATGMKAFAPSSDIFKAFSNELVSPHLYPHGEAPYLLQKNNLKSRYFYMFAVLNNMRENILEHSSDCVITFQEKDIAILLANDSVTTIRYLFKLQTLPSDYICSITTLDNSRSSEEISIPAGIRELSKSIRNLIEIKCFPQTDVSFVSQTPEHHLYVTIKPESAIYIELTQSV